MLKEWKIVMLTDILEDLGFRWLPFSYSPMAGDKIESPVDGELCSVIDFDTSAGTITVTPVE